MLHFINKLVRRISIPIGTLDTGNAAGCAEIDIVVAAGDAEHVSRRQLAFHLGPLLRRRLKDEGSIECSYIEPQTVAPHCIRIYNDTSNLSRKTAQFSTGVQLKQSTAV